MSVVDRSFDHPMKLEERATMPLAGGIMQNGYQCGMLWGAALAAGAQSYRLFGPGPQAEAGAMIAAQRLVDSFRSRNKHIDCFEITEVQWKPSSRRRLFAQILKFFLKGGPIRCFRMAARYARAAFGEIQATFAEGQITAPSPPVSCAAMLAQKMGASDMHVVMAAGLAGGIGLSGGACGALGAAVWIASMEAGKEEIKNISFAPPRAQEAVDRFLESTDFEFECCEIVGRSFESIDDHAAFLRDGGCAELIEALAAS
jgi:hypothetical protein